jgi:hypothetical protein
MSPTLIGILTAVPAILSEYLYKTRDGDWFHDLHIYLPLQLCISYGVWRLVTVPGTTLLDAFVVWAFSTVAMRCIVSQVVLGEHVSPGTWAALGLLLIARYVQYTWR